MIKRTRYFFFIDSLIPHPIPNPPLPPLPAGRQALEKSVRLETEAGLGGFQSAICNLGYFGIASTHLWQTV